MSERDRGASVARSVVRDDLDPFDPPAECLTCGTPVPPCEQHQVWSTDGVPMWHVPDELQDVAVMEWAYCRPCFDTRMTQAGRSSLAKPAYEQVTDGDL